MTTVPQTYYQIWQMENFGNDIENIDTHHMQDDFDNGFHEAEIMRMVAELQMEAILN